MNIIASTTNHRRLGVICQCSATSAGGHLGQRRTFLWRGRNLSGCIRLRRIYSQEEDSGSSDGSRQSGAVAIPEGLKTAGSVFVLAGFLKILIVCFPFSTMAVSMYFQGLFDLGTWAAIKMMPLAIGIVALAKIIVDKKIHERAWAPGIIALCGVVALVGSRWAFARPRPSPLDPALAQYRRVQQHEHARRKQEEVMRGRRELNPPMTDRVKSLRSQSRF